jgi:type 1 fimbriae regulatory protein FimB/type 1 fimbriae regulatory protein FimE
MPATLRPEAPRNIFRKVGPGGLKNRAQERYQIGLAGASPLVRPPNGARRAREYLTPAEVEKLITEARNGRYGHRDATLILVAYRHGLRTSEIADLEWSQVELGRSATLHVRRAKNGKAGTHPLRGDEVRALRERRRQAPDSAFVFPTERGGPFTPDAINRLIKRIGERARFAFPVRAHMLRHACGYALANAGHDTRRIHYSLVHRSIQHTTRSTQLSGGAVQGLLEVGGLRGEGVRALANRRGYAPSRSNAIVPVVLQSNKPQ